MFIATEKPQLKEAVQLMIGFNLEMNKAVGILSDIQCYSLRLFKEYTLLLGLQWKKKTQHMSLKESSINK